MFPCRVRALNQTPPFNPAKSPPASFHPALASPLAVLQRQIRKIRIYQILLAAPLVDALRWRRPANNLADGAAPPRVPSCQGQQHSFTFIFRDVEGGLHAQPR